jgi:glycine/D-amino acid oxidase-like deaminating enzyme
VEGDRAVTSRRSFLSSALIGLTRKTDRPIAGSFVNDSFALGHRIRDGGGFATPKERLSIPVVIVGGGIGGLSAAWRLDKRGFRDFVLLEMERSVGGNARWGENDASRYPWAAHYLPVPGKKSALVRELCEEFGLLVNGHWNERHLCFSPQERLFLYGRWQEGIEPELAATARDREQYARFNEQIARFRATGQFTIPMETGAKPSELDQMSMSAWLEANRFDSPFLRWYIDYCCRDDFGARAKDTSAWAGIHYHASREPDDKGPLTWPEGNGWLVQKLEAKLRRYLRPNSPVYSIRRDGRRLLVATEATEYIAERVIFAAPTFLSHYIIEAAPKCDFVYSPWLTANLTLDRMPAERGIEPAWDNVIYDSPALGYVVATHMTLRSRIDRTVWTFYWSLADGAPAASRRLLLEKDWNYWKEAILNDLARAHPDIRQCVARIDIMRLGHAMARPVPGFLGDQARKRWSSLKGDIVYANSDLSGFSIFEEAQYRGVRAADAVLARI